MSRKIDLLRSCLAPAPPRSRGAVTPSSECFKVKTNNCSRCSTDRFGCSWPTHVPQLSIQVTTVICYSNRTELAFFFNPLACHFVSILMGQLAHTTLKLLEINLNPVLF
ncbi:hypothetical protein AVEN_57656-1 [Araneus ventricosus]|uniref:Uncharacterized protein n=1 Tax=Araneus ventricosus TaxID=182803 RepID=A0A4Y2LCI6_ARAVE|nr:hypothetical protein AVEN_57656-1 [Araneus ventricosus]